MSSHTSHPQPEPQEKPALTLNDAPRPDVHTVNDV